MEDTLDIVNTQKVEGIKNETLTNYNNAINTQLLRSLGQIEEHLNEYNTDPHGIDCDCCSTESDLEQASEVVDIGITQDPSNKVEEVTNLLDSISRTLNENNTDPHGIDCDCCSPESDLGQASEVVDIGITQEVTNTIEESSILLDAISSTLNENFTKDNFETEPPKQIVELEILHENIKEESLKKTVTEVRNPEDFPAKNILNFDNSVTSTYQQENFNRVKNEDTVDIRVENLEGVIDKKLKLDKFTPEEVSLKLTNDAKKRDAKRLDFQEELLSKDDIVSRKDAKVNKQIRDIEEESLEKIKSKEYLTKDRRGESISGVKGFNLEQNDQEVSKESPLGLERFKKIINKSLKSIIKKIYSRVKKSNDTGLILDKKTDISKSKTRVLNKRKINSVEKKSFKPTKVNEKFSIKVKVRKYFKPTLNKLRDKNVLRDRPARKVLDRKNIRNFKTKLNPPLLTINKFKKPDKSFSKRIKNLKIYVSKFGFTKEQLFSK